jgi:hypothetical protein
MNPRIRIAAILSLLLSTRVGVEILGSQKCRIVGKSQPVLMMIDPMISTRTRRCALTDLIRRAVDDQEGRVNLVQVQLQPLGALECQRIPAPPTHTRTCHARRVNRGAEAEVTRSDLKDLVTSA